ncbi:ABC transporter ATP-binding protein [Labrys miyagiensis]|uniref:ABC transporter ATP-binding protein n=1 Tax=Labrys miyagiensis TaxID=346912 RepID=A0ABQ6CEQ1_9HYPH|nr:ABC transporter ATP-binding protein [Labrys miyagiensis]GLS18858.1 ABC transporter ATP-binding protein [Labrys miyagiensis]
MSDTLLAIDDLDVRYPTSEGEALILTHIDFAVPDKTVVGLVGESGSGKSTLALALMGLLPENARISASRARFAGRDLQGLRPAAVSSLRGEAIAMVFQDPMTALNPLFTVGTQLVDIQRRKRPNESRKALWERGRAMLERVGVPDPAARMHRYPHEFSGGMRQRVVIAMALLVEPRLLIADEPTTALDATIEAQIVEILKDLRNEIEGSVLVISHSFGLIAELCDSVVVLYAGGVVETGPTAQVLTAPRHPYTKALLACEIDPYALFEPGERLATIPGVVPNPARRPAGCSFAARCASRHERCSEPPPFVTLTPGRGAACWLEVPA